MASPDSHSSPTDTGFITLDIEIPEEQSPHADDNETTPLNTEDSGTRKKIDYVLVYETVENEEEKGEQKDKNGKSKKTPKELADMREQFENKMREEAKLELTSSKTERVEHELDLKREILRQIEIIIALAAGKQPDKIPKITRHFVLIHAPWEALAKRAEEMHIKVPFQKNDIVMEPSWLEKTLGDEKMELLRRINPLKVKGHNENSQDFFMANFRQDSFNKFVSHQDKDNFFDNIDRVYMVQQILFNAGLKRRILDGAYVGGFPLHDGPDSLGREGNPRNDRQRLKRDWARPGRIFKYQPYRAIKNYFGSEIALYFAWVGFYTAMLVPLAIVGLIVFLYGIGSAGSHIPVKDVCDDKNMGKWYMCPLCDRKCSYWDLASTTCLYAYVTHFFDNDGTVVLAVIASIWGTLFLAFWKRRQGILAHELDVYSLEEEEEPSRPEFLDDPAVVLVFNESTRKMEPKIPMHKRYGRWGGVVSAILFMIAMVIGAVVGVIVYRAAVFLSLSGHSNSAIQTRARIITSATAAFLNLVAINLMKFVYNKVAVWLTDWENPQTRSAYEYSFTCKMYLFQFVNTYASVFYIAFFKSGQIIGTPSRYERIADKFRLDGCSEQGCFLDLCVQLLVLMVGQQIIGIIMEIVIPYLKFRIKTYRRNKKNKHKRLEDYESDFYLSSFGDHFMFWEYLQVVLQYGFATMFVAAFPLGPLFALLSSAIRIRADAFNFVSQFRRPDIIRAKDIGAWYRGYHEDVWPYNPSKQHWEVIAVRLAFVFVFQFTVFFIANSITRLVPDVPKSLELKTKREKELIKSVFEKKQQNKETQTDGTKTPTEKVLANTKEVATTDRSSGPVTLISDGDTKPQIKQPSDIQPARQHSPTVVTVAPEAVSDGVDVFGNKEEVATTDITSRPATMISDGDTKPLQDQPADIQPARQQASPVDTVTAEEPLDDSGSQSQVIP